MGVESADSKSARAKKGTNRVGLTVKDYRGGASTLCAGCGHDAVTNQIIKAMFLSGVNPYQVAKMSGIGCSSKTPAYFLNKAHGFNTVHGRMPSVATGAVLANRDLICMGVSGDGDTASIGIGQFCHMIRRNVPMIYIVENNGVYGLTKGQFSATADIGSKLKTGVANDLPAIDLCLLAIELGCSYVARSFAADPKQLVALLQGALSHGGSCVLDVISPCVTFNNQPDSTKSYTWAKENEELLHEIDFVPYVEQLEAVDYEEGTVTDVEMHDGSHLRLRKVDRDFDPMNKVRALEVLRQSTDAGEFLTGLIYVNPVGENFIDRLSLIEEPLHRMDERQLRPPREALEEVMRELA